jgi:hypothetical protein
MTGARQRDQPLIGLRAKQHPAPQYAAPRPKVQRPEVG